MAQRVVFVIVTNAGVDDAGIDASLVAAGGSML
jgi:hypothetical protein